jgi:hypothetical protein
MPCDYFRKSDLGYMAAIIKKAGDEIKERSDEEDWG